MGRAEYPLLRAPVVIFPFSGCHSCASSAWRMNAC